MTATIEQQYYSPAEVSELLGLSRTTCYRLISSGVLPTFRLGGSLRVAKAELDEWIGLNRLGEESSTERNGG